MPDSAAVSLDIGVLLGLPWLDVLDGNPMTRSPCLQLVLWLWELLCETRAADRHFGMPICGGGWIVTRLVFKDRFRVRSTTTFAKGLNGYRAARSPLGQA